MGYTGFHTIYYHGYLKDQLQGLVERLAAMEQRFLYAITYGKDLGNWPLNFSERLHRLLCYYHSVGVVNGYAFGRDYNGCLKVVFDSNDPSRVFIAMQFDGLDYVPEIDDFMIAVSEEVLLDFVYNVKSIRSYGTLTHEINVTIFDNFISDEVNANA